MTTLVIVEAPGKKGKIGKLLGAGYTVEASVGHIRDLPTSQDQIPEQYRSEAWASLGVNPDTFDPIYVVNPDKRSVVSNLRRLAAQADEVLIATDADREGESIGWHIARVLKLKNPKRITFTEITASAIKHAVANPRPLNMNLVSAQETRRILDRLVGYTLSPLVREAVQRQNDAGVSLSAGRVQSAALMLIARRELSRMSFLPARYYVLKATSQTDPSFTATVFKIRNKQHPEGILLANDSAYDNSGKLKEPGKHFELTAEQAKLIVTHLSRTPATVTEVKQSEVESKPKPPYITSSLQGAAKQVGMNAEGIMKVAQKLYEGGYITYMRTDSLSLSDEGLNAARKEVEKLFGPDALPPQPRQYATRDKNAQEAHEAIRPTGATIRDPGSLQGELDADQLLVYTLIYKRTVASQMLNTRYAKTDVVLSTPAADLKASGKQLVFDGYTRLLKPSKNDDDTQAFPQLTEGQTVRLNPKDPEHASTSPVSRYTEETLLNDLKAAGIGRPSTYGAILSTLSRRGYTIMAGDHLAVSAIGLLNITYLAGQVPKLIARDFTAQMEDDLDNIAKGQQQRVPYLRKFWTDDLAQTIQKAEKRTPDLPLPHLAGHKLRASQEGPRLVTPEGGEIRVPAAVIPANLSLSDVEKLAQGTWKAERGTRSGSKAGGKKKTGESGSKSRSTRGAGSSGTRKSGYSKSGYSKSGSSKSGSSSRSGSRKRGDD